MIGIHNNSKFRVISFIQNPLLSYVTQSHSKTGPSSSSITSNNNNVLIRAITCKSDGELTQEDVTTTKIFLNTLCEIGMADNYHSFVEMLLDKYDWKLLSANIYRNGNKIRKKIIRKYSYWVGDYYYTISSNGESSKFMDLNSADFSA